MCNCSVQLAHCHSENKKNSSRKSFAFFLIIFSQVVAGRGHAEESGHQILADLSLEDLASLPVISVSKMQKPVSEAAASIFVITERDIHNAGSTSLPEALRLAPNLQVARVDARNYAITARGFNNAFENKLLVMIDGRTVYSPLFSGVYWDAQDVVLEDLHRIEVVSGAGGTLWGANAVNGVVNVVTKSAAETQGELVSIGGSNEEQHELVRHGGTLGDGYYRVYAKHSENDNTFNTTGLDTETGWQRTQAGFRTDWDTGAEAMTLQGDAYTGRLHQLLTEDIKISGANILARKGWQLSGGSTVSLQAYADHTQRDQPGAFDQHMNTFDLELQQTFKVGDIHNLVWGGGYRYLADNIHNDRQFAFLPAETTMTWRNIFIQDEVALKANVNLTLGSKWEDNPYTGLETMPTARIAWAPDDTKLVWAGASRAVRSPSRIDRDLYAPSHPPIKNGVPQYGINGGPDFESEVADVFEMGYRSQPIPHISWSATVFYSDYDKLRTLEINTKGPGLVFKNMAEARAKGVEIWASWQVMDNWRLHAGAVAQEFDASLKPGGLDLTKTTSLATADPDNYWTLRSSFNFSANLELDASLRHVAELESTKLPAYTALDVNLTWALGDATELSLMGQNLLMGKHAEFGSLPGRSLFEPEVFAKLLWTL